jgi:hypothetical protein
MPLFYLFWRSITPLGTESSGGIWALLLGSIVTILQFFLGSFITPGGFGFSRWVSACIDIVTLPAVLPLGVCLLFSRLKVLSGPIDYTNFALLWLIPASAIRAVSWSGRNDPILLLLTPLLWTAIAVGIPVLIKLFSGRLKWLLIPISLSIAAIPLLAAASFWAFFSQKTELGFLFCFITLIPLGITVINSFYRSCTNR